MTVFKILFHIPWLLLFVAGILVLVGSLALYSASQGSWQPWAGRHAVRAIVGIALVVCIAFIDFSFICLLYTSPSPRDRQKSRMPSSA